MAVNDMVPLLVAVLLGIFTLLRTPSTLRGSSVPLWIAHLLIVSCLLLAVTPVYEAVDGLLGGTNQANLLSHLAFNLIFLAGCRQVSQSLDRPDITDRICWRPGLAVLLGSSALIVLFFVVADTPAMSMGLNLYRDDPWVIAYKAASYIYPAYCSALLVPPLYAEMRRAGTPRIHRWAKGLLAAGFVLVVPVPLLHAAELLTAGVRPLVDAFIYSAILLVAGGPLLAFVARLRHRQGRNRATAYTTAPMT